MMLIDLGREYCLWVNVGFPFVNPTYEATYFVFDSWQHLLDFMLEPFDPLPATNSS
ncbi:MAG: hypothetical protein ACKO2V_02100 [Snowella sp.]